MLKSTKKVQIGQSGKIPIYEESFRKRQVENFLIKVSIFQTAIKKKQVKIQKKFF